MPTPPAHCQSNPLRLRRNPNATGVQGQAATECGWGPRQKPVVRGAQMSRHPNYRLVKMHRNYTVEEIAGLLNVHKNTVRGWTRQGLPTIDRQRPTLILGSILSRFLQDRRQRGQKHCAPGEIYCVKCRLPVRPAGDMAEYLAKTATWGVLRGICPRCESLIHRLVSWAKLDDSRGSLEITISQARLHIVDSRSFSVNCDSNGGG
jgi:hypothetical protein